MMFLPQPITKLGVFEAETVDAALTVPNVRMNA